MPGSQPSGTAGAVAVGVWSDRAGPVRPLRALLLASAATFILAGGLIGLGLVALIVPGMAAASGGMVPIHGVAWQTWALGIGLMIVIGLIVGLVPAWRAMRLNIVDALSGR